MPERRIPSLILILSGLAGFWLCLVLLFAAQTSLVIHQPLAGALRGAFGLWLPWMLISPLMLLAAWFLPLGRGPLWLLLPAHLILCLLLLFLGGWLALNVFSPPDGPGAGRQPPPRLASPPAWQPGLPPPGGPGEPAAGGPLRPEDTPGPTGNFLRSLPVGLPLYAASLLLISSLNFHRRSLERERQAAELEKQLSAARLETLRSQLQPHFLFNTLNTLVSLLDTNPRQAEAVLLNLSNLLRATLDVRSETLVPLRRELQLARDYLAIQQVRYGEGLQIVEEIPPATLSCAVPPLILQPILENAIKYAVEANPNGARIFLRADRIGDKLVLDITDTGAGRRFSPAQGHGIGVANVQGRLHASFPKREVAFNLLPNEHGGVTARLEVPAVFHLTEL